MGLFKRSRKKENFDSENFEMDEPKDFSLAEEQEDLKEHNEDDDFWPPFVKKPKI
jgi:hypothetical protein